MALAFLIVGKEESRDKQSATNKFDEIFYYINNLYVDSVNQEEMTQNAINGILSHLDPHSTYSTPQEKVMLEESLEGSFEGVGIQFNIMNDTVMVIAVVAGGPSEKVGIKAGDRLIAVDSTSIAGVGVENNTIMKLLRGKKNTKVDVKVYRPNIHDVLSFTITRDVIPNYTVNVSYMVDSHTGYIGINQFGSTTGDEFESALLKLKQQGMDKLILDLRGNGGGYLEAAIRVCDEFLNQKQMILFVEGLHTKKEKLYATRKGNFEEGEVVVLIDEFSASASEIVAGAIQDNDRGIIVGRRSFGKGLVQQQIELSDGSSIRLTTSRYHTPSGRCIQKDYKEGIDAYNEELIRRYENGEMDSVESIYFDDNLKYFTNKGRVVYGGGGIMPDIFVPLDREELSQNYLKLINASEIVQFAFDYTNSNSTSLKKSYNSANAFVKKMKVSDNLLNEYLKYYALKHNEKPLTLSKKDKSELKIWLKALIGRNLYQDEAFYPIINSIDKCVIEAMKQ